MGQFEYLLLFASIILALAVSDLSISLNRLLAAGHQVRWDWLAPLAALLAFLRILSQWWAWFGAERLASGLTFGMFFVLLSETVLLFLMAAAALPDELPESGIDLADYFRRSSRRYWLLYGLHMLLGIFAVSWVEIAIENASVALWSPYYLIPFAAFALAFIRYRLVHTAAFLGLIGFYGAQFFTHVLGH